MPAFLDLDPGTRLRVTPPRDPFGVSYESTVRAVLPSMLRLSLPRREHALLAVTPDDQLTMFTVMRGRVFRFGAQVREVEPGTDSILIDMPHEVEHAERRRFYRLETRIVPRRVVRLDDGGNEAQDVDALIMDVSGGGMMLRSPAFVPAGSRLRLIFELEGDPFDADLAALVISCAPFSTKRRSYRLHCQLLDPTRTDVERLVRYVYRQQTELRRKGVI